MCNETIIGFKIIIDMRQFSIYLFFRLDVHCVQGFLK